jgi:hypothetical protein
LKKHWIPGQARNDENTNMSSSANCDTVWKARIQKYFAEKTGQPPGAGMTVKLRERSINLAGLRVSAVKKSDTNFSQ